MKRFTFRLDRVVEFRKSQRRAAEILLQQTRRTIALLQREESAIDSAAAAECEERSLAAQSTGRDLAASEVYLKSLAARRAALRAAVARNRIAVEKARLDLIERDRQVRLLDSLRGRRLLAYQSAEAREQQVEAGEHSLHRWRRRTTPAEATGKSSST